MELVRKQLLKVGKLAITVFHPDESRIEGGNEEDSMMDMKIMAVTMTRRKNKENQTILQTT